MLYKYKAEIVRVVDADTLDVVIDLGFSITIKQRIRLAEVNAYESHSELGGIATKWLQGIANENHLACRVHIVGKGKYWTAWLWVGDLCINEELINKGYAKPYQE